MPKTNEELKALKAEVEEMLAASIPPTTGGRVSRKVRIRRGHLTIVQKKVTLKEPPLGGGAALIG